MGFLFGICWFGQKMPLQFGFPDIDTYLFQVSLSWWSSWSWHIPHSSTILSGKSYLGAIENAVQCWWPLDHEPLQKERPPMPSISQKRQQLKTTYPAHAVKSGFILVGDIRFLINKSGWEKCGKSHHKLHKPSPISPEMIGINPPTLEDGGFWLASSIPGSGPDDNVTAVVEPRWRIRQGTSPLHEALGHCLIIVFSMTFGGKWCSHQMYAKYCRT